MVAHFWYINCHVSATLPGLICTSLGLSSDCLIHSQGCSPLTHFILPFHHVLCALSSISMMSIVMPVTSRYVNASYMSFIARTNFKVSDFGMLFCTYQIYSMESPTDTA